MSNDEETMDDLLPHSSFLKWREVSFARSNETEKFGSSAVQREKSYEVVARIVSFCVNIG